MYDKKTKKQQQTDEQATKPNQTKQNNNKNKAMQNKTKQQQKEPKQKQKPHMSSQNTACSSLSLPLFFPLSAVMIGIAALTVTRFEAAITPMPLPRAKGLRLAWFGEERLSRLSCTIGSCLI